MSFGFSVGDAITLAQLGWRIVQNCRKACGEYDSLTLEVTSLYTVLRQLEAEILKPESLINRRGGTFRKEIQPIIGGCQKILRVLDQVLNKYNELSDDARSGRQLWQKIRYGNGVVADMRDIREKLIYYTSALSLQLNMVSMGSVGRVEQQMNDAVGDLKGIQLAVNNITAHLMADDREGSVLTSYADDDKAVWKEFRRELIRNGLPSHVIHKHKATIKAYIKELGDRGVLDETIYEDAEEEPIEESLMQMKNLDISSINGSFSPGLKIPGNTAHIAQTQPNLPDPEDFLETSGFEKKPDIETPSSIFNWKKKIFGLIIVITLNQVIYRIKTYLNDTNHQKNW